MPRAWRGWFMSEATGCSRICCRPSSVNVIIGTTVSHSVRSFGSGIASLAREWSRVCRVEPVRFIGVRRVAADGFVLKEEIAEAVADRPALVQLDAPRHVRSGAEERVGAGVDARMRERLEELVGRVEVAVGLVRVNADEHDPRVAPRDRDRRRSRA